MTAPRTPRRTARTTRATRAAAAALAALLPLTLVACGGSDDEDSSDRSGESSDNDGKDRSAEEKAAEDLAESLGEDGNASVDVEINDLPEGFPEDEVPLVGEVTGGTTSDTPSGTGWSVTTSSDKSVEDAFEEAKSALLDAGYEEQTVLEGQSALLRGDRYGITLVATSAGGSTVIGYTVVETP